MSQNKEFLIGEITIDESGLFRVYWVGEHPISRYATDYGMYPGAQDFNLARALNSAQYLMSGEEPAYKQRAKLK